MTDSAPTRRRIDPRHENPASAAGRWVAAFLLGPRTRVKQALVRAYCRGHLPGGCVKAVFLLLRLKHL